jgi:RNA polymerase sigma factor (sigma-70 family)
LFSGDGNLGAWLMSILKNVIRDYWIEQHLLRTPQMDGAPLEDIDHPPVWDEYEDGTTFKNEQLEEAFNNLIPIYKEIVILSFLNEQTDEQIAKERNLTLNTVKQRRFRAKANLEKQLLPEGVKSPIKAAIERNRKTSA